MSTEDAALTGAATWQDPGWQAGVPEWAAEAAAPGSLAGVPGA